MSELSTQPATGTIVATVFKEGDRVVCRDLKALRLEFPDEAVILPEGPGTVSEVRDQKYVGVIYAVRFDDYPYHRCPWQLRAKHLAPAQEGACRFKEGDRVVFANADTYVGEYQAPKGPGTVRRVYDSPSWGRMCEVHFDGDSPYVPWQTVFRYLKHAPQEPLPVPDVVVG